VDSNHGAVFTSLNEEFGLIFFVGFGQSDSSFDAKWELGIFTESFDNFQSFFSIFEQS